MEGFHLLLFCAISIGVLTIIEGVRDIQQSRERNIDKLWRRYQAQSRAKGLHVERTREWEDAQERRFRLLAWFGPVRLIFGVVLTIVPLVLFGRFLF